MRRTLLMGLAALAWGCGSPDPEPLPTSSELSTGEIGLTIELRSNGGLAQAVVTPFSDSGPLEMTGGDALLLAAAGGPELRLTRWEGTYYGQMETPASAFEVILARGAERVVSPIDLPPPFALSGPPEPAPRSAPIAIAWDMAEGEHGMRIDIGGPCLSSWFVRTLQEDVGMFEIQPADLGVPADVVGCALVVEVTRAAAIGALAPELAPSRPPLAEQIRALTVATVP